MKDLDKLKKEIPYKWREGPGGRQLAYIDARDVMDLLDEVVGVENWQCEYRDIDGKVYCGIGIWVDDKWVWKWDMGVKSDFEADKGEASDAFKRAGVKWGIGRFLYNLEDPKFNKKDTERKGKLPKDADINLEDFLDEPVRDTKGHVYCSSCGKVVSKAVEKFSLTRYGKVLCMRCQKDQKKDENDR